MGTLIAIIGLAIFTAFVCSFLEAVLLSIPFSYVHVRAQQGGRVAKDLVKLKSHIENPLSAVLTVNTCAGVIGATAVGAQARSIWGNDGVAVLSVVMTVLVLFVAEIVPKVLGAKYWRVAVTPSVEILRVLVFFLAPVLWFSARISRLFGAVREEGLLSRSELLTMTEVGAQRGIFRAQEFQIIHNVLRLQEIEAHHIMTPRLVVMAAPQDSPISTFFAENRPISMSRIPIYERNIDKIVGYALKSDLLEAIADGKGGQSFEKVRRDILVFSENMSLPQMLDEFHRRREHIALVVDEHGGMAGILTMEDIVETILGIEIMDESDSVEDMRAYARNKWAERSKSLGLITDEV